MAAALPFLLVMSCGAVPRPASHQAANTPVASMPECEFKTPIKDGGLTPEQQEQLWEKVKQRWLHCYTLWLSTIDYASLKWSTLPRYGMDAQYARPEGSSLSEAKANATLIVTGTVRSLSQQKNGTKIEATFSVTQVLKGQAAKTLLIATGAHLEPRDDWQTIVIVEGANPPLLLPGESLFLFLKTGTEGLYPISFTGTYYIRNERVQALDRNPSASKVNGLSAAEFAAAIANA